MSQIDFVITWVDGSDEKWLKQKAEYSGSVSGDNRAVRFRDWEILKYWFRAVELYAPWVRKIHFVTWGHVPSWLNTEHPKLNIVKHEDFIPAKYLPTFNSNAIEWNLHRIKGLSEQFVYFNDDMFLLETMKEKYWFKHGKPCDQAMIGPYVTEFRNSIASIVSNNIEVINTRFKMKEVLKRHFFKWYHPCYGKYNLYNIAGLLWPIFTGLMGSHYPNAYLKSSFEVLWEEEYNIIDETCRHRFREKTDVNHWLVRYWQIVTGNFIPRRQYGSFLFTADNKQKIKRVITDKKTRILCLNDSDWVDNFEEQKRIIHEAFDIKLASKSSFEL